MSYGFFGLKLPQGVTMSFQVAKPISQAQTKFNIPASEIIDMAELNNLQLDTITSVLQIRLTNASGEYVNDRITFQVDATAVLGATQTLHIMRRPRGRTFTAEDQSNGQTFSGQANGVLLRDASSVPMNLASGAGIVAGRTYTVQSFADPSAVLLDDQGATVTVSNGSAAASWIDIMSETLPTFQRGTKQLKVAPQTWEFTTPCSEFVFAGEGSGGGGAVGDPYIMPLRGPVFKLRSEPQCYRMWSDQRAGGDLVVNARVDFLRDAEYAAAARTEAGRGARHGGMGQQAAFLRYLFVQKGEDGAGVCVDLERLCLVRPADGRSWDAAARTYDMVEQADPLPWHGGGGVTLRRRGRTHLPPGLWSRDRGLQRAYGHIRTVSLELVLASEVYGEVRLVCSRFPDDPSVRTSVHVQSPCVGPDGAEGLLVARTRRGVTLRRLDDRRPLPADWHDPRDGRVGRDDVQVVSPEGARDTVQITYVKL